MSRKQPFELPDFYLPWPARLNPHVDGARMHSKAWAREVVRAACAWQIGTMEAASYYGRLAANAILDAAGSSETPANAIGPYRPPEWQPLKQIDAQRYASGEANLFDVEGPLPPEVARLLENEPPR